MGRHSDFRISSFEVVDAWRILQEKKQNWKFLKSLYGFGGCCHKIIDVYMIYDGVSLSIRGNLKLAPVPYATLKWLIKFIT